MVNNSVWKPKFHHGISMVGIELQEWILSLNLTVTPTVSWFLNENSKTESQPTLHQLSQPGRSLDTAGDSSPDNYENLTLTLVKALSQMGPEPG